LLHEDRRVRAFVQELFIRVAGDDLVLQGFVGGFVNKLLNMIGALLVLLWRNPSERSLDGALGFAADVMLAASFTSLILPGITIGGILPIMIGVRIGALMLDRADAWVPHQASFGALLAHDQYGAMSVPDHSLGNAAHQSTPYTLTPPAAHHYQSCALLLCQLDDLTRR
jgi:zinc transporter ZupT